MIWGSNFEYKLFFSGVSEIADCEERFLIMRRHYNSDGYKRSQAHLHQVSVRSTRDGKRRQKKVRSTGNNINIQFNFIS